MRNPWRDIYDLPQSSDPWKNGVPDFALYLDVEPTNSCNFNCSFCVAKQQMKRPKGLLDLNLFEKVLVQAEKYGCKGIRFLRWGEPLLHPQMATLIRMSKTHKQLTHMTTNGSLLNKEKCEELIDAGLDSIIVSFQGTQSDEHNKLRGDTFPKVYGGLKTLREVRDSRGVTHPFISVSTTITDETEEQTDEFRKMMEDRADYVGIGYTWFRRLKDKSKVQDFVDRAQDLPHTFKCQEVMVKLSIDWDGTVSPCCLDYDQQLSVGNIETDDLMDLWNSEDIKAIRTLLSNKRQDMFVLCQTCELNYSFRGKDPK